MTNDQAGGREAVGPQRPGLSAVLRATLRSRGLTSVALLAFSSSLPLGLVWIAIPAWMARLGVDIRIIGLFGLAQLPWSFKFLWSPVMDRFAPPLLGRRRGWILLSQLALIVLGFGLAREATAPVAVGMIGALALLTALASATQDIAIDAYAVEVLDRDEHGAAVGARSLFGRAGMLLSGGVSITLAAMSSWRLVHILLALSYLPMLVVTWRAPEPRERFSAPRSLRAAIWEPVVGFLEQERALEILAFVVLFKLTDNLTQALLRPFFVRIGFGDWDVGVGTMLVGTIAMVLGTMAGGLLTERLGLGRALWVFGILQMVSNLGYAVLAQVGPSRLALYAAQTVEMGASGLGTGAFSVLLLRLTQKQFSATQYALLSSLMAVTRVLTAPLAGVLVDAIGWRNFFVLTVPTGLPALWVLSRFASLRAREPRFHVAAHRTRRPLGVTALVGWGALGGLLSGALAATMALGLGALRAHRFGGEFDLRGFLWALAAPTGFEQWTTTGAVAVTGALSGLATAAALAARRGVTLSSYWSSFLRRGKNA
jgi:PAT family beta-lactamase induction signal transducer AmpG